MRVHVNVCLSILVWLSIIRLHTLVDAKSTYQNRTSSGPSTEIRGCSQFYVSVKRVTLRSPINDSVLGGSQDLLHPHTRSLMRIHHTYDVHFGPKLNAVYIYIIICVTPASFTSLSIQKRHARRIACSVL